MTGTSHSDSIFCPCGPSFDLDGWHHREPAPAVTRDELAEVLNALADCVVKATEYGTQDGGFVANYISPTGPIHRAIPLLERHGITVRPGFDGRPKTPEGNHG